MKLNKIEEDIIDTGIRVYLETDERKHRTKASVKRMLTALDLAKRFKLDLGWEELRPELEAWLNEH